METLVGIGVAFALVVVGWYFNKRANAIRNAILQRPAQGLRGRAARWTAEDPNYVPMLQWGGKIVGWAGGLLFLTVIFRLLVSVVR